jgi:hypothetical protein
MNVLFVANKKKIKFFIGVVIRLFAINVLLVLKIIIKNYVLSVDVILKILLFNMIELLFFF